MARANEEKILNVQDESIPREEKKRKIRIPRERDNDAYVFVSVNDRTWKIKKGIEVEVPECVVEVLRRQEAAISEAYDFEDGAKSN